MRNTEKECRECMGKELEGFCEENCGDEQDEAAWEGESEDMSLSMVVFAAPGSEEPQWEVLGRMSQGDGDYRTCFVLTEPGTDMEPGSDFEQNRLPLITDAIARQYPPAPGHEDDFYMCFFGEDLNDPETLLSMIENSPNAYVVISFPQRLRIFVNDGDWCEADIVIGSLKMNIDGGYGMTSWETAQTLVKVLDEMKNGNSGG